MRIVIVDDSGLRATVLEEGLRDAGYVRSEKGHGGGWAIAADLGTVSLLDIHRAVGGPRIFAIGSARSRKGSGEPAARGSLAACVLMDVRKSACHAAHESATGRLAMHR